MTRATDRLTSALPGIAGEARLLTALAWPVMLSSLNWTLLHITDIYVVGLTGTHQVAIFGASRVLAYVTIMVMLGMLSGVLVYASRADGAGDRPGTGAVLRDAVVLALVLAVLGAAPYYFFAEPILHGIGVAEPLVAGAAQVIRIMALAMPAQLLLVAVGNYLEGISRPRRVAAIQVAILPLNLLLAWAWADGHLGLPRLGAVGAAWATLVCLWVGAIAMFASALLSREAKSRGLTDWSIASLRRAFAGALRLARFGAIPALASGLEIAGFSWLMILSTRLGDTVTHSFQIIFSMHNISFGIALGFASAAGVRVGNAVGEGRLGDVRRRTLIAAALGISAMASCVLLYALAAPQLVALFPAGPGVHALATAMLLLWVPFILFDGAQIVFTFALRSLGDQTAAGIINITAFFGVTGIGGWGLYHLGYGPTGLVLASGLGMLAAAVLNTARFAHVSKSLNN